MAPIPQGTYALLRPRSDAISKSVDSASGGSQRPIFDSVRGPAPPPLQGYLTNKKCTPLLQGYLTHTKTPREHPLACARLDYEP